MFYLFIFRINPNTSGVKEGSKIKSKRIPDDVLPPCSSVIGSNDLANDESPSKKRGRKRKHTVVIQTETNETVIGKSNF